MIIDHLSIHHVAAGQPECPGVRLPTVSGFLHLPPIQERGMTQGIVFSWLLQMCEKVEQKHMLPLRTWAASGCTVTFAHISLASTFPSEEPNTNWARKSNSFTVIQGKCWKRARANGKHSPSTQEGEVTACLLSIWAGFTHPSSATHD